MRVSELCSLPVKSVIFPFEKNNEDGYDYKFITIRGKGGKERIVPIRARVLSLLKEYISLTFKKGQKYLFSSNDKDGYITRRTIVNIIKTSAMLSGIDANKVSPHKIRHSFATHLLEGGANLRDIQQLLGHESILTTEIYTHINVKYLQETIMKYHPRNRPTE
jgi:integrase/recombinase XerD